MMFVSGVTECRQQWCHCLQCCNVDRSKSLSCVETWTVCVLCLNDLMLSCMSLSIILICTGTQIREACVSGTLEGRKTGKRWDHVQEIRNSQHGVGTRFSLKRRSLACVKSKDRE